MTRSADPLSFHQLHAEVFFFAFIHIFLLAFSALQLFPVYRFHGRDRKLSHFSIKNASEVFHFAIRIYCSTRIFNRFHFSFLLIVTRLFQRSSIAWASSAIISLLASAKQTQHLISILRHGACDRLYTRGG